jgi:hypothetical protein
VRQPTPIGDYCFIEDMEDHEIPSLQPIRDLDALLFEHGLPHPFVLNGLEASAAISSQISSFLYGVLGTPGSDGQGPLHELLRKYREWLEHIVHDLSNKAPGAQEGPIDNNPTPNHRRPGNAQAANPWSAWGLAGLLDPQNATTGPAPVSARPVSPDFQRLAAFMEQVVNQSPFGRGPL